MFDTANYRQWFDGLAEFIPEVAPEIVVARLKKIFQGKVQPVTADEIAEVQKRFDWKTIIEGFWQRCMN
jgi:hypothetical protein